MADFIVHSRMGETVPIFLQFHSLMGATHIDIYHMGGVRMKKDESQYAIFRGPGISPPLNENCQVIPFPLNRRVKKIATTAQTYSSRKTDDGKSRFWNRTISELSAQLKRLGATDIELDKQIRLFRTAVNAEISNRCADGNGGDNAS